jgi:hypothetical protein
MMPNPLLIAIGAATAMICPFISGGAAAQLAATAPFQATCRIDDAIPSAERDAADDTALALTRDLANELPNDVYAAMLPTARAAISLDNLGMITRLINVTGPYEDIKVAHTYLVEGQGAGRKSQPVLCGKSLNDPDRVSVATQPVPKQFYVEVTAHSLNNDWSMVAYLVPGLDGLQVASFNFNASAISGRAARDLSRLARAQAAQGHALNAALLYRAAEEMAGRGPNLTPVWKTDIDNAVAAFQPPPELAGKPPFRWRFGDDVFTVDKAGLIGAAGGLDVIIDYSRARWPSDAAADAENRRLITALVKAHPELADSFADIVARARKPDGTGLFSTVYEFGKGFAKPPG